MQSRNIQSFFLCFFKKFWIIGSQEKHADRNLSFLISIRTKILSNHQGFHFYNFFIIKVLLEYIHHLISQSCFIDQRLRKWLSYPIFRHFILAQTCCSSVIFTDFFDSADYFFSYIQGISSNGQLQHHFIRNNIMHRSAMNRTHSHHCRICWSQCSAYDRLISLYDLCRQNNRVNRCVWSCTMSTFTKNFDIHHIHTRHQRASFVPQCSRRQKRIIMQSNRIIWMREFFIKSIIHHIESTETIFLRRLCHHQYSSSPAVFVIHHHFCCADKYRHVNIVST